MNVLDLFCGCGGLSYGFKLAGYDIVGGIDIDKDAINTFNENFKNAIGICEDISTVEVKQVMKEIESDIDIIIGGPPCQGFSNANRYNNEEDDPRNKLFFEFVKFVKYLSPKFVVIENVRGIVTQNNGYAKKRIYEIFEDLGYYVNHAVLDASDFGVPQKRLRNFFIISKNEVFDFNRLTRTQEKTTVKDAIGELYIFEKETKLDKYIIESTPTTEYRKYLRKKDNTILNHDIKYPASIVQERIKHVPQGGNWRDVPPHLFPNKRNNRHSSAYKRLKEDDTSVTIDTGNAHSNYFHPIYNRIPTVREAARIQSFKDEFIFCGSRTSQYRQVGNAVPPLLAKSIAESLKELI